MNIGDHLTEMRRRRAQEALEETRCTVDAALADLEDRRARDWLWVNTPVDYVCPYCGCVECNCSFSREIIDREKVVSDDGI